MYLVLLGWNCALSIISLILSTQVLLAASISIISISLSSAKSLQILHCKQGFQFCGFSQLIAFAIILAVEVLPVHLGQHNKYAHTVLLSDTAFCKVSFTNDCHTKFLKSAGLYFRYNDMGYG
ncbi:MAG: hypothetical protein Q8S84_08530 [bacterium]|nr:hypothetical protein [bacterium]MDP3381478.1 hypothetical protein [bacterium]